MYAVYLYILLFACPITKVHGEPLPTTVPYFKCFVEAGKRYGVDPALLMSIGYNESRFKANALNRRPTDRDLGIMQINTWWLPKLQTYGIREHQLIQYPCVNINIGAWIYSGISKNTNSVQEALGIYNAGFKPGLSKIRAKYAKDILEDVHYFNQIISLEVNHVAQRN